MSTLSAWTRRVSTNVWLARIEGNVRAAVMLLLRTPRHRVTRPGAAQLAVAGAVSVVVVLASMTLIDAWAADHARRLPRALLDAAGRFTDLGKSGWFLWPLGVALMVLAVFSTSAVPRFARQVLAAWALRLEFVFLAIGLPSLFDTIIKRLIGRSRPFVDGLDVWAYHPLSWHPKYASFPSGHTATAFAALVAVGAIFPQARGLLWIYAVLIGLSRIAITAHYTSDVIAAAIVGATGAWLVQHWFAERRLVFLVKSSGTIRAMPGPNIRRIAKAVARSLHSA